MKEIFFPTLVVCFMLLALSSCKKETTGPSAPAPPQATGNATVNSVSLNGGSVIGRWTSYLYYRVRYQNDTLQTEVTDTVAAGAEIINFLANGVVTIWIEDTVFVDSATYSVNGNVLTITTSTQDVTSFTFGVSGNRMRWHETTVETLPPNVIRTEEDVILERY